MKITLSLSLAFVFLICYESSFAQTATSVLVSDTRNINDAPGNFKNSVKFEFKQNSIVSLPAITGEYSGMMTVAPWIDVTGGLNYQLNFNQNGLYYRNGSHTATWNPWQKLVIADGNGNVGIGLNNPTVPLQVSGTTIIGNPLGNNYNENLRLPSSNIGYSCISLGAVSGVIGTGFGQWSLIKFPANLQSKFSIRHNAIDYFSILTNGYVGIGTDNPKEMLSVNGKVRAHEIKVETTNWPDYVFKPNYQLLPLSDLESFVKTYNHLPEIPTASVIENDGLMLGEMNKKMIKKIEEMTLYIIDQQKLIEAQNKRLEKLEQLINKQN